MNEIKAFQTETVDSIRVLVIQGEQISEDSPVLLYLHGKGEASPYLNQLPKVCFHLSPPFQAFMGRLCGVTVLAPQIPKDPEKEGWNWRNYTKQLGSFLEGNCNKRTILATGFSRGGLGVLQLIRDWPGRIEKWAIVDPQRAGDDAEEKALHPAKGFAEGWLRYGEGIPKNKPFGNLLSEKLNHENTRFVQMGHGDLALAAYAGDPLSGDENLYQFLLLDYLS